jgi:hypothetical protein
MQEDFSNFSIDLPDLRSRLDRLHQISSKSLKHLSEQELQDFSNISKHISSLYGTDGYNLLYKEIVDHFPISSQVIPGTVGGYFLGCAASSNFKYGSECAITCLTGVPTSQDNCGKCSKSVFLAPFDNGYTFTQLALGDADPEVAIIYVNPPFIGFNDKELEDLSSKGVKQVIVSYFDEGTKEYSISNETPCDALPRRNDVTTEIGFKTISTSGKNISAITDIEAEIEHKLASYGNNSCSGGMGSTIIKIVVLLLLLSLLGFLVWKAK